MASQLFLYAAHPFIAIWHSSLASTLSLGISGSNTTFMSFLYQEKKNHTTHYPCHAYMDIN